MITIPPVLPKPMDMDAGTELKRSVAHGELVAKPAARPRKRYAMAELLEGSAAIERLYAEVAWAGEGDPVGHEIT